MDLGLFIGLVLILFIMDYLACINYLKILRKESNETRIKQIHVILICALFGGPALLITYMFPEIRADDIRHNHAYIICGVIFTILQGLLIFLLIYFGVVKLYPAANPNTALNLF